MNRYRLKFRVLRTRLESWGRKWGLENAQSQEENFRLYSTEDTRKLIFALLGSLEARQSRDEKIISRYNLFVEQNRPNLKPTPQTPAPNTFRIRVTEDTTALEQAFSDEASLQAQEQRQSPLTLKAMWAKDVDKVDVLRRDVEDIIDDLERLEGIREEVERQSKKSEDYRLTHAASTILHQSLKVSTQLSSCFQLSLKLEKDRQSLVPFAKLRLTYLRKDTMKFSLILSSPPPSVQPIEFISVVIETYRSPRSSLTNNDQTDLQATLAEDLDELLDTLKKPRPNRPGPFLAGGFLSIGGEQSHLVYRVPFHNGSNLSWVTLSKLLHQQGKLVHLYLMFPRKQFY